MIDLQTNTAELAHLNFLTTSPSTGAHRFPSLEPGSVQADLSILRQACDLHCSGLDKARAYYVDVAQNIAELIAGTGLQDVVLPRDYQVRQLQNELYLVKYSADGTPLFVATGQENLFTRLELKTTPGLRPCDLAEFAEDLRQGLLAELTAYVNFRLRGLEIESAAPVNPAPAQPSMDEKASALLDSLDPHTLDSRTEQLKTIGRRARRAA